MENTKGIGYNLLETKRRWQSGQLLGTVNPAPIGLRRFESCPTHTYKNRHILCLFLYVCFWEDSNLGRGSGGELSGSECDHFDKKPAPLDGAGRALGAGGRLAQSAFFITTKKKRMQGSNRGANLRCAIMFSK